MKKFILIFALLSHSAFGLTDSNKKVISAQAVTDGVKMYRQAGTCTEILMSLKTTDQIIVMRKHNANWTIVRVGEQVGYVLHTELTKPTAQTTAMQRIRK